MLINNSSQFCVIFKLAEGALHPIIQITSSLMKKINSSGPSIQGLQHQSCHQLNFVLFITLLWAQQFNQLSVHLTVHLVKFLSFF